MNIHTDPGTRSSSTARLAMCVAAFCIADDKPKLEQNRLYGKTALPYGVASGSVDSLNKLGPVVKLRQNACPYFWWVSD